MPLRSGFLASCALTIAAAFSGWSLEKSWPRYSRPSALASSSKPCARWSVVEMPGLTLTTNTLPLPPISSASAFAASLPPPMLSEAICETAMSGCSSVVSTSTTFEPPSASALIGAYIALVSVGAISTRVGLLRRDRVDDRRLQRRVELVGPLEVERVAELLRLLLGAAVHRDVELVALDAGDQRELAALVAAAARRPPPLSSSSPHAARPNAPARERDGEHPEAPPARSCCELHVPLLLLVGGRVHCR